MLRRLSRSGQIVIATLALMAGVVVERRYPNWIGAALGVVSAAALIGLRLRLGLVVLVVFGFGVWRADATEFSRSLLGQQLQRQVEVVGTISDDPGVNDKNQIAGTIQVEQLNGAKAGGAVRFYTPYKKLQRGFRVSAAGKLRPSLGAVPAQISFAQVTVLSAKTSPLERWRQKVFTGLRAGLPEPLSGFGLGLLIGVRALISKPLQDTLNAVGLSHLIAVSGYNLTIIIQAARRLLQRVSSFVVTAVSLWLILGFLLVAGFSASIVRAALVSSLGIWTAYYGFEAQPLTLIALPAFITVAWNPDYLLRDVGWQLSFLAFFGIMVLAPLLLARFVPRPNAISSLVVESMAAQITTAPLILGLFGNLSLVSPLSNAVVLPLVPLAMLMSFLDGMVALASSQLAAWVALPATGLLGLMVGLIQWFATWPYANLKFDVPGLFVLAIYMLIGLLTLVLWRAAAKTDR